MNFIYFICPEVPQYAKYCEGFYNHLTYGYRTWQRDRYVSTTPGAKVGRSRLLKDKHSPESEEMRAGDFILDRIYKKVVTSDCYEHTYRQITDEDINESKLVVYITSNKKPKSTPKYLNTEENSVVVWRMSNIKKPSSNKFELLEGLLRNLAKPIKLR